MHKKIKVSNLSEAYDLEKVELFYKSYLNDEIIDDLCYETAQNILTNYFIERIIDNASYEKEIFKSIKKILILKLQTLFQQDLEFTTSLAIFIFKKHFKLIFNYLSEALMYEVAYSNENVINFLKYYSLDTIVVERLKYVVPQIKEENGPRWNVVSMLSVLKTYVKTQDQLDLLEQKLQTLESEAQIYYVDEYSPYEYNNIIQRKFEESDEKIKNNALRINAIRDYISLLQEDDELTKAKEELNIEESIRLELREEKAQLVKAKIKQFKLAQYEAIIKQIEQIQREKLPKQKIIEQNKDSYISIKNALMKALISKKQAL